MLSLDNAAKTHRYIFTLYIY